MKKKYQGPWSAASFRSRNPLPTRKVVGPMGERTRDEAYGGDCCHACGHRRCSCDKSPPWSCGYRGTGTAGNGDPAEERLPAFSDGVDESACRTARCTIMANVKVETRRTHDQEEE